QLTVRPRAPFQHFMDIIDRLPAADMVYDVVHELEQFVDQNPRIDLFLLPEIDQGAVDSVPPGPPLVFVDQRPVVDDEIKVAAVQRVKFGADRLEKACDGDGLVHGQGYVADAELDGV